MGVCCLTSSTAALAASPVDGARFYSKDLKPGPKWKYYRGHDAPSSAQYGCTALSATFTLSMAMDQCMKDPVCKGMNHQKAGADPYKSETSGYVCAKDGGPPYPHPWTDLVYLEKTALADKLFWYRSTADTFETHKCTPLSSAYPLDACARECLGMGSACGGYNHVAGTTRTTGTCCLKKPLLLTARSTYPQTGGGAIGYYTRVGNRPKFTVFEGDVFGDDLAPCEPLSSSYQIHDCAQRCLDTPTCTSFNHIATGGGIFLPYAGWCCRKGTTRLPTPRDPANTHYYTRTPEASDFVFEGTGRDIVGFIKCTPLSSSFTLTTCATECKNDAKCGAFVHWGGSPTSETSGTCCTKELYAHPFPAPHTIPDFRFYRKPDAVAPFTGALGQDVPGFDFDAGSPTASGCTGLSASYQLLACANECAADPMCTHIQHFGSGRHEASGTCCKKHAPAEPTVARDASIHTLYTKTSEASPFEFMEGFDGANDISCVAMSPTYSLGACAKDCLADSACSGFVHVPTDGSGYWNGVCCRKRGDAPPWPSSLAWGGRKIRYHQRKNWQHKYRRIEDHDTMRTIACRTLSGSYTFSQCLDECTANPQCGGVNHVSVRSNGVPAPREYNEGTCCHKHVDEEPTPYTTPYAVRFFAKVDHKPRYASILGDHEGDDIAGSCQAVSSANPIGDCMARCDADASCVAFTQTRAASGHFDTAGGTCCLKTKGTPTTMGSGDTMLYTRASSIVAANATAAATPAGRHEVRVQGRINVAASAGGSAANIDVAFQHAWATSGEANAWPTANITVANDITARQLVDGLGQIFGAALSDSDLDKTVPFLSQTTLRHVFLGTRQNEISFGAALLFEQTRFATNVTIQRDAARGWAMHRLNVSIGDVADRWHVGMSGGRPCPVGTPWAVTATLAGMPWPGLNQLEPQSGSVTFQCSASNQVTDWTLELLLKERSLALGPVVISTNRPLLLLRVLQEAADDPGRRRRRVRVKRARAGADRGDQHHAVQQDAIHGAVQQPGQREPSRRAGAARHQGRHRRCRRPGRRGGPVEPRRAATGRLV
ncbi:unnamed protein product [Pedinophyceae sp. YPF-701]|nr:unnamed protein product [Pedinophyceae sp. YPF-701]